MTRFELKNHERSKAIADAIAFYYLIIVIGTLIIGISIGYGFSKEPIKITEGHQNNIVILKQ